jgi:hypothetical protein
MGTAGVSTERVSAHDAPDEPLRLHLGERLMFNKADYFILVAALASFLYSVALWFGVMGAPNKEGGLFVAVWVPSILSLGCFAKIATRVRSHG